MSGPNPIETSYAGYRFRSRLEARWAVFFDAVKIKWVYEQEGFYLGPSKDVLYLPDFWLPDHELYVEIKPPIEAMTDFAGAAHKASLLAKESKRSVIVATGECFPYSYRLLEFSGEDGELQTFGEGQNWHQSALAQCSQCEGLCHIAQYREGPDTSWVWGEIGKHTCKDCEKQPSPFPKSAYYEARAARFGQEWRPKQKPKRKPHVKTFGWDDDVHEEGLDPLPTINLSTYFYSQEWKSRAHAAIARAGYSCMVCNSDERLEVRHRTYDRLGNEYCRDLIVLCDECRALLCDNRKLAR